MAARTEKPGFFYGYAIVIACFFMMVVWWGTFHSFGVFFESLLEEFDWTRAATSGAVAVNGIFCGLFAIPISKLCDRFGPQIVIGATGLIGGIGYLLMSRLGAVWQLYLIYATLIAVFMGSFIVVLPIVARWFVGRRGLMTGVVFSGMGIGMMVIPPLTSRLIAAYGWRFSYLIIGGIALVGIMVGAQFLRRDPRDLGLSPFGNQETASGNKLSETVGLSFQEALRSLQFWQVSALYFIFVVCQIAVLVHIVIHAIGLGVPATSAANLIAVFGVFLIAGMNIIGMVADRLGGKSAFVIGFAIMTIAFLLIILTREIWVLYLFAAVMGFATGGIQVLFSPMVAELFGLRAHGVILGAMAFIAGFGGAVGPTTAGYIFDVTGSYTLAFIACGILAAAAFMIALLLRPLLKVGGTREP